MRKSWIAIWSAPALTALWMFFYKNEIQSGVAPDESGLPPHSKFSVL
jgi:hypothetical protein